MRQNALRTIAITLLAVLQLASPLTAGAIGHLAQSPEPEAHAQSVRAATSHQNGFHSTHAVHYDRSHIKTDTADRHAACHQETRPVQRGGHHCHSCPNCDTCACALPVSAVNSMLVMYKLGTAHLAVSENFIKSPDPVISPIFHPPKR